MNILNKIVFKFYNILFLFLAFLLFVFIRSIKYFKIIRVLKIDFARIGTAYDLDWYLIEKKFGVHDGFLDIFFEANLPVANQYWRNIWVKKLIFFKFNKMFLYYEFINKKFSNYEKFEVPSHGIYLSNNEFHKLSEIKKKNYK